jgi:PAS domain S-box-containing protein
MPRGIHNMIDSIKRIDLSNYIFTDLFHHLQMKELGIFKKTSLDIEDLTRLSSDLLTNIRGDQALRILNIILTREIFIEIFKSIQEGVEIVDSEGIIRYVNPAFLRIVGLEEKDRIGKSIFDVSPDGSLVTVIRTGKPVNNLKNYPKGTSVKLVSSAIPIYIQSHMIGAIAFVQDVEEIISLNEKLRESEKMVENLSEKMTYYSNSNRTFEDVIGNSVAMQNVIEMAKIAAQSDAVVLIQGETGTGKEVIANAIHKSSTRSRKPFISINCSAIAETLLESEFFGHEKGSFTGAYKRQLGKFELANGGTLFLDEIGDMNLSLQGKILRAIQEREIRRVGGETNISLDVRIISATNRNLKKMVAEGTFREDLYYRLNVWNIVIPPLRERRADIEVLVNCLLNKICRKLGKRVASIHEKAMDLLYNYNWPGNVRELENVLERSILNLKGNVISAEDFKFLTTNELPSTPQWNTVMPLEEAEKQIIKKALEQYGDSYQDKKKIAQVLGISLATLYNKLLKYNL